MKNIIQNRDGALLKVILLGVALAMSLVMFSKVWFENSYENFVPHVDRTYQVTVTYVDGGKLGDSSRVSGGIVGFAAAYTPQIEMSTRFTLLGDDLTFARAGVAFEESRPTTAASIVAADSLFFEMFPTATTGESPKTTLANLGGVMISRSLAEKMSGNSDPNSMIGVSIRCITRHLGEHVVKGLFEDFPENSDLRNIEIITPIDIMGGGKDGVLGNDRYQGYIRLIEGANIAEVEQAFVDVKEKNILAQARAWGVNTDGGLDMIFHLLPLSEYHSGQSDVKIMTYMLTALGIAMLLIAMLNYVLIAVTALVKRAKNIATRRCYGAPTWVIYKMLIGEALATLLLSLALAALLIFALQEPIEEIVGVEYYALFGWGSAVIVSVVSIFVVAVCGILPAVLYSRIPLAAAFTRFKESNTKWKHALLAVQFAGAMFFVSLLGIIAMQYRFALNLDMGYNYENIITVQTATLTPEERLLLKEEISKIAGVETMSYCSLLPLNSGSGNDAELPEDANVRFNIRDFYSADENYIDLLGIEIVAGRNFSKDAPVGHEILVSQRFITEMEKQVDWGGNAIGRELLFSEHSQSNGHRFTICGVFKEMIGGTSYTKDSRPQVIFFSHTEVESIGFQDYLFTLMIKVEEETPEITASINELLQRLLPEKMLYTQSYTEEVIAAYSQSKKFRNMVLYAGLIVLIITLIGLVGYTRDEIQRRRSEVAIRKIHGATTAEIIHIFMRDIVWLLAFGIVAGAATSLFAASKLLEMFAYKIPLSWWIFASSAVVVVAVIAAVILLTTRKAADANPVENLS
ncbi:MAG: FtsX-like permease family protein [Rikenellaceae bacterium]